MAIAQRDIHRQLIDASSPWTAEIRTWLDDRPVDELLGARGRKLTLRLDAPSEYQFTLSGRSRAALQLQEMVYDLVLYRSGQAIFRGRLGSSQDDVGPTRHDTPFSVVDYRGLLDRRHILIPTRYDQWNQSDIAWHMVSTTQAQPFGQLGIIRGLNPPGQPLRDRSYDPGKKVGEALTQLGRVINGFDWEIDAQRRLNIFYPQRGADTGAVLDYGTHIRTIKRSWTANDFMTVCVGTGAEGTQPYIAQAMDLGRYPQGRIEGQFSDQDISVASTLQQYTNGRLEAGLDPTGTYECELMPGVYDPRSMVLGNSYQLRVRSGRLSFERTLRITEVDLELQDDGSERVKLVLGKVSQRLEQTFRQTDTRLERLEARAATQTYQKATASGRAVLTEARVDIGQLAGGGYGIDVNGTLIARRGVIYRHGGWGVSIFYNWYPPDPQPGDVVLVPR